MTNRDITIHYAISTIAAAAAWYYIHPAAAILTFIAVSALQTLEREHRQNQ